MITLVRELLRFIPAELSPPHLCDRSNGGYSFRLGNYRDYTNQLGRNFHAYLGPLMDKYSNLLQRLGGNQYSVQNFLVQQIFYCCALKFCDKLSDDEICIRLSEAINGFVVSRRIKISVYFIVPGVLMDRDGEISDSVFVETIDELKIQRWLIESPFLIDYFHEVAKAETCLRFDYYKSIDSIVHGCESTPFNVIDDIVHVMSLWGVGKKAVYTLSFEVSELGAWYALSGISRRNNGLLGDHDIALTYGYEELKKAVFNYKKITGKPRRALKKLKKSRLKVDADDKLMDLIMALEALYGGNGEAIGFKVGIRCAFDLAVKSGMDAVEFHGKIKELYKIRSKISHGHSEGTEIIATDLIWLDGLINRKLCSSIIDGDNVFGDDFDALLLGSRT